MPSWIVGLCSVLFDVDVGPRVNTLVPDHALTAEEKQDIAFHAFPVRWGCISSRSNPPDPSHDPFQDSLSFELHAKTTIRDRWARQCATPMHRGLMHGGVVHAFGHGRVFPRSCFFFRIKRRGDHAGGAQETAPSGQGEEATVTVLVAGGGESPQHQKAAEKFLYG